MNGRDREFGCVVTGLNNAFDFGESVLVRDVEIRADEDVGSGMFVFERPVQMDGLGANGVGEDVFRAGGFSVGSEEVNADDDVRAHVTHEHGRHVVCEAAVYEEPFTDLYWPVDDWSGAAGADGFNEVTGFKGDVGILNEATRVKSRTTLVDDHFRSEEVGGNDAERDFELVKGFGRECHFEESAERFIGAEREDRQGHALESAPLNARADVYHAVNADS